MWDVVLGIFFFDSAAQQPPHPTTPYTFFIIANGTFPNPLVDYILTQTSSNQIIFQKEDTKAILPREEIVSTFAFVIIILISIVGGAALQALFNLLTLFNYTKKAIISTVKDTTGER